MRRLISSTGKNIHSIASEHMHQHISVHNIPASVKPPPWLDRETIRSITIRWHGSRSISTYLPLASTTCSRGRNSTSRRSTTTWFKRQRSNTNLYPISPYLRIGESLLVQQQEYVVTKAKKQTTNGLGFRRRRHAAPSDQGRFSTINRQDCGTWNWPF